MFRHTRNLRIINHNMERYSTDKLMEIGDSEEFVTQMMLTFHKSCSEIIVGISKAIQTEDINHLEVVRLTHKLIPSLRILGLKQALEIAGDIDVEPGKPKVFPGNSRVQEMLDILSYNLRIVEQEYDVKKS